MPLGLCRCAGSEKGTDPDSCRTVSLWMQVSTVLLAHAASAYVVHRAPCRPQPRCGWIRCDASGDDSERERRLAQLKRMLKGPSPETSDGVVVPTTQWPGQLPVDASPPASPPPVSYNLPNDRERAFEEALRIARELDAKVDRGRPPPGSMPGDRERMKKEAEAASEANAKEAASRAAREAAAKAAAEAAEAAAEAAEASKAAEASSRKKEARLAAARQSASEELMAAMQAMDYGQRAGTDAELKRIRAAIQAARDSGMLLDDIARAEQIERLAAEQVVVERRAAVVREAAERAAAERVVTERLAAERAAAEREAAARAAAERAERERAEREKAERERAAAAEAALESVRQEVREEIRRSVGLPGAKRKALLRSLQVKWHPDRQYETEATRQLATELSAMINDAMMIAKANMRARGEL